MTHPTGDAKLVRDGLFLAASRTYAEQYVEPFIRFKYELNEPSKDDHDALDKLGAKYEIKASKILKESENGNRSKSLYERVLFECENQPTTRLISFKNRMDLNFLANIQNVKRDHFKTLIYVLLFEDCIAILWVDKDDIKDIPGWSEKHGRYDALGKSGQFGITNRNINWHLTNYLRDISTYEEMSSVYKKISGFDAI